MSTTNSAPARLTIWANRAKTRFPNSLPYVSDTDISVRLEAVKALDDIGGPKTVDALVKLRQRSTIPKSQIRATDGLVNVYLPGYLKTGISGTLAARRNFDQGQFSDTNDQVIDAYVEVRPDVIAALGKLARRRRRDRTREPTPRGPSASCAAARRFRI